MGKMLYDARSKCEPIAFFALAFARDSGEGKLWVDPEQTSYDVRSATNLHAFNLIYTTKFSDGKPRGLEYLNKLSEKMTPEQRDFALSEGQRLFETYCKDVTFK
jgi:hypothetical protein